MSLLHRDAQREPFTVASRLRDDFYGCLTARRDELFELMGALLCAVGAHVVGNRPGAGACFLHGCGSAVIGEAAETPSESW